MKFTPLTTMIMSAAVLADIATAKGSPSPAGGQYECGNAADYNEGNAFLFQCSKSGVIEPEIENCNCPDICPRGCCLSSRSNVIKDDPLKEEENWGQNRTAQSDSNYTI
ncbi:hypothetical protein F4604DRAFT_1678488 [Suillus subluteus]|nr:hypothetical protein F4604DRAFT_1678488 [Suillus subluteus]